MLQQRLRFRVFFCFWRRTSEASLAIFSTSSAIFLKDGSFAPGKRIRLPCLTSRASFPGSRRVADWRSTTLNMLSQISLQGIVNFKHTIMDKSRFIVSCSSIHSLSSTLSFWPNFQPLLSRIFLCRLFLTFPIDVL